MEEQDVIIASPIYNGPLSEMTEEEKVILIETFPQLESILK